MLVSRVHKIEALSWLVHKMGIISADEKEQIMKKQQVFK